MVEVKHYKKHSLDLDRIIISGGGSYHSIILDRNDTKELSLKLIAYLKDLKD